ncbi:enoyl-CoA hydratase [Sphingomonas ginkgonis]|uniref:Enoyl-CoA hydratase n=1 Tax=Sphingomonas ginkgonis TaxID=2315330 RepID=A0A3R9YIU5_9SPHN|nr:enoyl-CoA hydratase-related protein [Sphingomonas ginkgonis]RST30871.1 enoyl-CoA hydratase [Sphingomonas ginkgonis]
MSEQVRVERREGRLAITLSRPEARNAITVAMYAALADAIEGAADDPDLRLITLEGEGVDFTAGNDLKDFLGLRPEPGTGELPVHRLLKALARNPVPIAAAVHGNAVGIGSTLLFHCDLVMAEEGSRFVMPFVDLGLVPEAASSLLLPRLAGRRAAARYLLLGEPFDAETAERIGLASHRVPAGTLGESFEQLCAALLAKPPEALRLTQRLLRTGAPDELIERMDLENRHFGERLQSDEVKTAIAGFFAGRERARS